MNNKSTIKKIINFIKKQVNNKPIVLGLSGGIDSALVAYLAVKALGNKKVHCLIMPSDTNTEQDLRLAKNVARYLNIQYSIFNIKQILKVYSATLNFKPNKTTVGNLKARIRMSLLYSLANQINGIVIGTGNKTEISVGYFTKYGDGGVDILPIGNLYKTQVWKLSKELGVPQEIIDRPPTAGLWTGQTDENEMGITYETLDKILTAIEKKKSLVGFKKSDLKKVKLMMKNSEHKRMLPPVCK